MGVVMKRSPAYSRLDATLCRARAMLTHRGMPYRALLAIELRLDAQAASLSSTGRRRVRTVSGFAYAWINTPIMRQFVEVKKLQIELSRAMACAMAEI